MQSNKDADSTCHCDKSQCFMPLILPACKYFRIKLCGKKSVATGRQRDVGFVTLDKNCNSCYNIISCHKSPCHTINPATVDKLLFILIYLCTCTSISAFEHTKCPAS